MYNVGDEVIVKTVNEMLEDGCKFKISGDGKHIECPGYLFVFIEEMRQFCGRRFYIKSVDSGKYKLVDGNGFNIKFFWEDYMLKSAEEKSFDIASELDIAGLYNLEVNVVMNPISQNNSMEFKVGKRYKWNPYVHGTYLWKNGILERIEEKNGHRVGHFITRDGEDWSIPIDNEDCNVKPFK